MRPVPPQFQLRVRRGPRSPERFPRDEDALGERLGLALTASLERGLPRPAMLLLRDSTVEQVDLVPVLGAPRPHAERMLAALAGQDGVEAAALVGMLRVRGPAAPRGGLAAVVYAEWPDNRWWTSWRYVGPRRELLGEEPMVRRAVDGWPRPGGMGGWFARARRTGVTLRLEGPPQPTVH